MSPNAPNKGGRPSNKVYDENNNQIVGLSYSAIKDKMGKVVKNRYYATKSQPRKWFGFDLPNARIRFSHWVAEQAGTTIQLKGRPILLPDGVSTLKLPNSNTVYEIVDKITPVHEITEVSFFKELILRLSTEDGRGTLATGTGQPLFNKMHDPSQFPDTLTLEKVGSLFYGKRNKQGELLDGQDDELAGNDKQKAWMYWKEFTNEVGVKELHNVTRIELEDYRKAVKRMTYTTKKGERPLGARTIKNRYDIIGMILSKARDMKENHTVMIDKVRDSFRIVVRKAAPKVEKGFNTPIEPEDYSAMLKAAEKDTKWKAILLLAMNCGLHTGEVAGLKVSEINLMKATLLDHRNKNKNRRCSMLWSETVEAIAAYINEYEPTEYLFTNKAGKTHESGEFGKEFYRKVRDVAGVKKVTFKWFRKSGTSAAQGKAVDIGVIRLWLGQNRRDFDSYANVDPLATQTVVDAIYVKYMVEKGVDKDKV